MPSDDVSRTRVLAIVAARNESQRIAATLAGLARAFPDASIWVADDGSTDGTAEIAERAGARVVRAGLGGGGGGGGGDGDGGGGDGRGRGGGGCGRGGGGCGRGGKGQAMAMAVATALHSVDWMDDVPRARTRAHTPARVNGEDLRGGGEDGGGDAAQRLGGEDGGGDAAQKPGGPVVVLCDGDLGFCASELAQLVDAVRRGEAELAVAAFSTRATGGFGIALAFARWAIRRRCGLSTRAPLSGQRAMRAGLLRDLLPFAPGYGMEIAMTIDAVHAGYRVLEIPLKLSHRPTGRTPAGFAHRGRQLFDCVRVYVAR